MEIILIIFAIAGCIMCHKTLRAFIIHYYPTAEQRLWWWKE